MVYVGCVLILDSDTKDMQSCGEDVVHCLAVVRSTETLHVALMWREMQHATTNNTNQSRLDVFVLDS